MKKWKQRGFAFVLALSLTTGLLTGAQAAVSKETLNDAVQDTAEYMYRTVQDPQVGSIGGEWAVLGLARSGYDVPDSYYQDYYATVETYVKACDGKLHDKKYTEYSRVIVALSSIGKDARNVGGYDLTKPLGDYDKTIWQGLNGPIWALIALDSRDYPMRKPRAGDTGDPADVHRPHIGVPACLTDGWSLFGGTSAAILRRRRIRPGHHRDGAAGAGQVSGSASSGKGDGGSAGVHVQEAEQRRRFFLLGD